MGQGFKISHGLLTDGGLRANYAEGEFPTVALVIVNSSSPLAAPIKVVNLSVTPSNRPNRLFSARAASRFFTVPLLSAPPVCFSSSATISDLSLSDRVGVARMDDNLGSDLRIEVRDATALAAESRLLVLTAATYCAIGNPSVSLSVLVQWIYSFRS